MAWALCLRSSLSDSSAKRWFCSAAFLGGIRFGPPSQWLRGTGSTETQKDFFEREATSYIAVAGAVRYWGGRSAATPNFQDA